MNSRVALEAAAKILLTIGSLFCLVSIPGAFVQAIVLAYAILMICTLIGVMGHFGTALINLYIICIAVSVSPFADMDVIARSPLPSYIALILISTTFLGIGYGVHKRDSTDV